MKDLLDGREAICIVAAPFCVAVKVNDYRYATGDEEKVPYDSERLLEPTVAKVEFAQGVVNSTKSTTKVDRVVLQATRLINPAEELYAYYAKDDFGA